MSLLDSAKKFAGPVWDQVSPRALSWRYLQKARPGQPIYTQLDSNLTVRVYPNDIVGRAIYQYGVFEPDEVAFVTRMLKPGMVFFDVGANLGQYTLIGARQVGPTGQVHSFEPSTRMYGELEYHVSLNSFGGICRLNHTAVSERSGTARLSRYEAGAEVYGSLGTQHWAEQDVVGYEDVRTVTLDEYVEQHNLRRVHLIKMDIEGAELPALRGARSLLSRPDAPAVVLEMADVNTAGFGYKALETWDYLESLGYKFFRFDRQGAITAEAVRPQSFDPAANLAALKRGCE